MAAHCGSSSSPSAPSTGGTALTAPTVFFVASQTITATNNELQLGWTSSEASFQLVIGTTPGSSNVLNTTLTTNSYKWVSPRTGGAYYARVVAKRGDAISGFSDELSLFVLDIRNVIDAMYFRAGPMADVPANANANPPAGIWPDGTRLRVLVSAEAGETARVNAQVFADQYAALVGGAITATTELTSDLMHGTDYLSLPAFTIGVRVQSDICSSGALACAIYGPAPIGPNRSIVTLAQAGGLNISAVAHEMGHTYGMGHITIPAAGRPEFRFLMNPSVASEQMTDAEKLAIVVARTAGLRAGMTRSEALSRDLVNPFTGTSNTTSVRPPSSDRRDAHGWIVIDRMAQPRSSHPNLSGTWHRVSEHLTKSAGAREPITMFSFGPSLVIAQNATLLKIAAWTLALDGTPSRDGDGAVSKAAWSGRSLVLTETEASVDGKPSSVHKVVLTLANDGTLTVDITATPVADVKLLHSVYRK